MKNNKDILGSILKTAQMGQTGIRSVVQKNPDSRLNNVLHDQLAEYNAIEQEALDIAQSRGWKLKELSQMSKIMSNMMSSRIFAHNHSDSRIAALMIQGNTRGIIKGIRNSHLQQNADPKIQALSSRLINCENNNIQQMKEYL